MTAIPHGRIFSGGYEFENFVREQDRVQHVRLYGSR